MSSRKDALRKAAHLVGLAAAHFALFGEDFWEGDIYNQQAADILESYSPNEQECAMMVDEAWWRAQKKIRATFGDPQKTTLYDQPTTEACAYALIQELLGRVP
ncbi:MAG: hypothetical protein K6U87_05585 [Firmicutes bacterium]|nr:hypothetical protein [Bacillota bacterium]